MSSVGVVGLLFVQASQVNGNATVKISNIATAIIFLENMVLLLRLNFS